MSSEKDKARWKRYYQNRREKKIAEAKAYYQEHKERCKIRSQERERFYKKKVIEVFGTKCDLCSYDGGEELKGIQLHERKGNKHQKRYCYVFHHKEDFMPLCYSCHQIVHVLMERFGVSYERVKSHWSALVKPRNYRKNRKMALGSK